MDETWREIYFIENGVEYDYRGLYAVSNLGKVKSFGNGKNTNAKERILHLGKKNGYFQVCLCKNNKKKTFLVHRLVAHLFIPNDDPLNKTQINHKDENKENNCVKNLEWCDRKYNINHGTRNERVSKINKKLQSRKVIGFSLTDTKVIILQSTNQSKRFGFSSGHISNACRGKYCGRHEYKGYCWYYLEDIKK